MEANNDEQSWQEAEIGGLVYTLWGLAEVRNRYCFSDRGIVESSGLAPYI